MWRQRWRPGYAHDVGLDPSDDPLLCAADKRASTNVRESFRSELIVKRDDVVDETWAGGIPAQYGVAPRVRVGRNTWFNLLWLVPIGFLLLVVGIAVAKG